MTKPRFLFPGPARSGESSTRLGYDRGPSWNDPAPLLGGRVRHRRGLHTLRHRGGRFDCSGRSTSSRLTAPKTSKSANLFPATVGFPPARWRIRTASKHRSGCCVRPHGPQNRPRCGQGLSKSWSGPMGVLYGGRVSGCAEKTDSQICFCYAKTFSHLGGGTPPMLRMGPPRGGCM